MIIIKIIIDYQIKSFKELFYNCIYISSIFLKKFYRINIFLILFIRSYVIDLTKFIDHQKIILSCSLNLASYKFRVGCSSLKELNLSNFNTYNVINMNKMFERCSSLKEINFPNFNTNNIINMSFMFKRCWSLEEINFSNFNINNLTNFDNIFFGCSYDLKNKIREKMTNN